MNKIKLQEKILSYPSQTIESVIFLTDRCSLNCQYCFVRKGNYILKKEYLKRFLNFLKKISLPSQPIELYFQGAELTEIPLSYFLEYKKIIEKFKSQLNIKIYFQTNLVNVDKLIKIIDNFEYIDRISTSYDPIRPINFETFKFNLEKLREKYGEKIVSGFVCTLTKETLNREEELIKKALELGIFKIRLREIVDNNQIKDKSFILNDFELIQNYINFFDLLYEKKYPIKRIEPLSSWVETFYGQNMKNNCNYMKNCTNMISLVRNGYISTCDLLAETKLIILGHCIDYESITKRLEKIRKRKVKECLICKYYDFCHQGCLARAKNFESKDTLCFVIKNVLNYIENKLFSIRNKSDLRIKKSL